MIYKGAFKGRTLQIVSKLRSRAFFFYVNQNHTHPKGGLPDMKYLHRLTGISDGILPDDRPVYHLHRSCRILDTRIF